MTMFPELPYEDEDGERTAGWSGSETSHARASRDALDGTASLRQKRALDAVTSARYEGLTWRELSNITGEHHGQTSGVLSVLHQAGRIARLKASRLGCQIYVHPHYVADRVQSPYRKRVKTIVAPQRALTIEERVSLDAAQERLDRTPITNTRAMVCLYADDLRAMLAIVEEHL